MVATATYDGLGRRIGTVANASTTGFAYAGANAIQEQDGSGTPTAERLTGGIDQVFSRTDGAGSRTLLSDALGSTLALVDGTGAITTSYTYEPFGTTTASGAASTSRAQFTGQENDGALYFYRSRYYNPIFGRFLSEDPAGFAGSGPNLYAYVGDDPTDLRDPSGKFVWVLAAGCGAGVVSYVVALAIGNKIGGRKDLGHGFDVGDLAASCAVGAVGGEFFEVVPLGIGGRIFAGVLIGTLGTGLTEGVHGRPLDPRVLLAGAIAGGVGSVVSIPAAHQPAIGFFAGGFVLTFVWNTLTTLLQNVVETTLPGP